MPLPAILMLTAALLPLTGFAVLLLVGRRMGNPLAGYVGTGFVGAAFICTMAAMIAWYVGGTAGGHDWGFDRGPIVLPVSWLGPGLGVGLLVDSLTVALFAMVTLVAGLVHIFSIGYMRADARYARYFAYLGLFCAAMLGLLLGSTLLHLFVCWELVGFCSYLLIGFWYEKRQAANAAIKAFIVNRVGDVGLLVALGVLFWHAGTLSLPTLWTLLGRAGAGHDLALPGGVFTAGWLTVAGIGLFLGAAAKSAQFPLHVWLADAMEGPTPASALIHAATMVAAGVYLLARAFPMLTPDAKLVIAVAGAVTIALGALVAVAQTDLKKVLAFSTVSQLGYMVLAIGVGSWVGGLFHLVTHAFFKALLFLAAGSVINAAGHEQEMPLFGGLVRKIPVTAVAFAVGVLAISGVGLGRIGFSGYFSKDMILTHAGAFARLAVATRHGWAYWLLFLVPLAAAYLTPFYMTRAWMMTFWGRPRHLRLHARAREQPLLYVPLLALAMLSVFSGRGVMNVQEMIEAAAREDSAFCRQTDPTFAGFETAWPATPPTAVAGLPPAQTAHARGEAMVSRYLGPWGFLVGIGAAVAMYAGGLGVGRRVIAVRPVRWCRTWLYNRMFFDELYAVAVLVPVRAMAVIAAAFDRGVVDGSVNAVARTARRAAAAAAAVDRGVVDGAVSAVVETAAGLGKIGRRWQTGRVRGYLAAAAVAVAVGLAAAVAVALSK